MIWKGDSFKVLAQFKTGQKKDLSDAVTYECTLAVLGLMRVNEAYKTMFPPEPAIKAENV
ncbi:MAG TPA: hypothetical protein VMW85_02870 [Methanomassiliicoccales archaeon]|nr:hypothetical protein [Methanomassiliicoccales archaeon]